MILTFTYLVFSLALILKFTLIIVSGFMINSDYDYLILDRKQQISKQESALLDTRHFEWGTHIRWSNSMIEYIDLFC